MLVAGLAALMLLLPPHEGTEPQPTLGGVPEREVGSIRVEHRGAAPLSFRRNGSEWSLTAPLSAPADPLRIRDLLAVPALPVLGRVNAADAELARFDLDPPLAVLRLDDQEFVFGTTDALDGRRYVRHRGQVRLVPDTVYLRLTQRAGFFIDPALVRQGMQLVKIAAPGWTVVREQGGWRHGPGAAPGDPPADGVAAAWETARALMVSVGAGEIRGEHIALAYSSGATVEFEFTQPDGHPVLLRRDLDLQYHLDPELARKLLLLPAADPDNVNADAGH